MTINRHFIAQVGSALLLTACVPVLQAASDDIDRDFTVQPGGRFVLDADGGSVQVRTGQSNALHVEVRNVDDMVVEFEQSGNEVRVNAEWDSRRNRIRTAFTIILPEQFSVDLQTSGGSITVASLQGEVDARTAGGSVRIGDTNGSVNASTAGGSVNIGNTQGDVVARTAGGSVTVGNVTGNAELHTAGGSVTADDVQGRAELETAGGSIHLNSGGSQVQVKTAGGSITVNRSGGPIDARTAGGSISLGPVDGSISARTAGGSIDAELGNVPSGASSRITLDTSGGDIELRLPADHQATVDAHIDVSRRYRGDYRVYTDFPLTIQGEDESDITARGDINGGGDPIRLETTNGDIRIRRVN